MLPVGPVTGQISISQVSQAEQGRVERAAAADWRKSRKLQEPKKSLRLFVNSTVGRDTLQKTTLRVTILSSLCRTSTRTRN